MIGGAKGDDLIIIEAIKKQINPKALIDLIFDLNRRYHFSSVGLETVVFQKVLKYWLEDEMRRRGEYLPIVELKTNARSKEMRILSLQPIMESGHLFINKNMIDLIDEVYKFRSTGDNADDLLDACAYLYEMMQGRMGIFDAPVSRLDSYKTLPPLERKVWTELAKNQENLKPAYAGMTDDVLGSDW